MISRDEPDDRRPSRDFRAQEVDHRRHRDQQQREQNDVVRRRLDTEDGGNERPSRRR